MIRSKSLPLCLLFAAAALPAAAASGRYAITADRIAAAVTARGMQVTPDQIVLLANVVASVADPEIRVKSIDPAGEGRAVARVECANSEQCLPFLVAVRFGLNPVPIVPPVLPPTPPKKPSAIVVHAGTRVTLLLEGAHVHITLPAISLDSGAQGQTIRAASLDRHQTWTAQVVADGILEGRL